MKITAQSKRIADGLTIAICFIALASFVLSYHTLVCMAMDHGMPIWLAWLWPLSLDLFMIAGCITVIRFKMLKENTTYPWAVVLVTTFASIGFNVASVYHTQDALTMTMFAVPPMTVFIALELLIMIIRIEQKHGVKPRRRAPRAKKPMTISIPDE